MKLSLTSKFTMGFLFVALIVAVLMVFLTRQFNLQALNQLLLEQDRNLLVEDLSTYYAENDSWQGVAAFVAARDDRDPPPRPNNNQGNNNNPQRPPSGNRADFGLVGPDGQVLVPLPPDYQIGNRVSARDLNAGTPVAVAGQVVGTVITKDINPEISREEEQFIRFINRSLLVATAVAVVAALILGIVLTRTLVRPIRDLTTATQAVAAGRLEQEVPVRSQDELGQLALAFNRMSADLAHANQARRQMTADIAHDLRSPLTVLAGYLESMEEGVLAPTPARLATMHQEVEQLQHLVTDLRTLSLVDAGTLQLALQPVPVRDLLQRTAESYQFQAEQKQVRLLVSSPEPALTIQADEKRMAQLLGNLVSNALRHTPEGGQVQLAAQENGSQKVAITVQDTGEGIPEADLPHIFHRFYRADTARHTEQSGLGLAITKSLVDAHGGTISVSSRVGQGTTFTMLFSKLADGYSN